MLGWVSKIAVCFVFLFSFGVYAEDEFAGDCDNGKCMSLAKIGPLAQSEIEVKECDPAQPNKAFNMSEKGSGAKEGGVVY